ncbi:tRNA (adenosine(37)-N6)-threonylcarbamoyltransferase complex dimerization subunit type 1 TsaB [bacterium SCSIO 12643]|nr:tRNA (adenosine(37)-N6)-threonylcarbamoyltransferase complex dimerization subunit type 1 TsaB [bacterium SCSIO 12643]
MATILNIETSTTVCSVAIGINGKLCAAHEINDGYSHAEQLEGLIEKSLVDAQLSIKDIDAISVSKGPGSYTGLRIGVSLVKGLCYGLKIPMISVPTLEAMANHPDVVGFGGLKVPMLDARRMEVYTCVLNADNSVKEETKALVLESDSFEEILEQSQTVFFGPGMDKSKSLYADHSSVTFIDDVFPSARFMIPISEQKFLNENFEDVAYFEPFYLKDFVAGKPKKML